jgi:hypothetical protein
MTFSPYASVEEADAYVQSGYGLPWDGISSVKLKALTEATRLMDFYIKYKGTMTDASQETKWPRTGVYDSEMRLIASDAIPTNIKSICIEIASNLIANGGFSTADVPVVFQAGSLKIQNDMKRVEENVFTKKIRMMIEEYGTLQINTARGFSQVSLVRV